MPTKVRNVDALLERARKMCDPPTWYQLAKVTGIKHQTLSRCMVQKKTLGDINAVKLGQFLGIDAATVMAYMAEDRAQDEATRKFWGTQLPRLVPSFAIALVAYSATTGVSLNDGRMEKRSEAQTSLFDSLYIMRSWVLLILSLPMGLWSILTNSPKYEPRCPAFVGAAA